jgi:C1A family cysteine protease
VVLIFLYIAFCHTGSCNAGYAFAPAAALEAYLKWKTGKTFDISEQDIIDCSYRKFMRNAHNGGCAGGWPTATFEYFNVKDFVPEDMYPYTSGSTQRHGVCRIPNPINNYVRGKLLIKNVRAINENEIAQLLVSKGPLVVAIATDGAFKYLGNGVFDVDQAIDLQPNHAVLLVAYGTQDGKDYWVIKNSWGTGWATQGYGKIRRGRNMCNLNMYGVWYVEQ